MVNNSTVFIVCGVFNHLEDTRRLIECIKKQAYPNIKTIIVDDGSIDGTAEYIQKKHPEIIVLQGKGNLWWTGAIRWAVEEVLKVCRQGDFILTVNNDCIFGKNYVSSLVQSGNQFKLAIVGSLAVNKSDRNSIYDAGMKMDWEIGKLISLGPKFLNELSAGQLYQEDLDLLSTKGTLYPIEVFRKIGNFDQKHFPHYLSDYEFSCRAKANGFRLILSYQAVVYNDIERTGLGDNLSDSVSIIQIWKLLFSRRSKMNMVDNFRFIQYCCPGKYKLRNYYFLISRMIKKGYKANVMSRFLFLKRL